MDGVSVANELRDKRDLLVDELSAIVDVSVEEKTLLMQEPEKPPA